MPHERLFTAGGHASFRWYPDGRTILLTNSPRGAGAGNEFLLLDIDSGEEVPVVDRNSQRVRGRWPALARRGQEILFIEPEADAIRGYDVATREVRTLYAADGALFYLALSPDERQLVFVETGKAPRPDRLMSLALDGGEPTLLFEFPESKGYAWGPGLTFTPDGAFLLFGRRERGKPVELWRLSAASGQAQRVMTFPKGDVAHLSVHPDGRRLAYSLAARDGANIWALWQFIPTDDLAQ